MQMTTVLFAVLATASAAPPAAAEGSPFRILRADLVLEAPVADVWKAWTTEEGVKTFFTAGAHIEPRVDGAYDILFDPTAAPGQRGAEGMRILVFEPESRLAFTWNAPPDQPEMRAQRTVVLLELTALSPSRTAFRFTHSGWGTGPLWDKAYTYFDNAWNGFVLPRLVERFRKGPLPWAQPVELAPVAPTLKRTLVVSAAPAPPRRPSTRPVRRPPPGGHSPS
jgi:uncharacterized protein YndB with AHSA1/START domain